MTRARRVQILVSVAVVAVIAVAIAVAVGSGGSSSSTTAPKITQKPGATDPITAMFAGIPANGLALGKPDAPATLEEYIDPQCPFCAQFSRDVLPTVVKNYVRTGKLRLVLQPEAFIGDDSVRGARAVVAAGEQNKAWPFLEQIFANQGQENTGYMNEQFLRTMAGKVGGLDAAKLLATANSDAVVGPLQQADKRATKYHLDSTPSFLITRGTGRPRPLASNLEASPFIASLEQALGQ